MKTDLSRRDGLRAIAALGLVGVGVAAASSEAAAAQPHMESALADLQAALHQLQIAAHDKGGHRVKAIDLVQAAISETRQGIAVGSM